MNTFTESLWPLIQTHGWKFEPRGGVRITTLLVHATRSGQPNFSTATEYNATKNWFASANNRTTDSQGRVSGAMTSAIIGGGGNLCLCLPDEMYPTWSAGHMDPEAWSVELCQPTNNNPYDPLDLERLEHELAQRCKRHGIPARSIAYMDGGNSQAPGIAYHDASRNGQILGKSDPGTMPPFDNRDRWVRDMIATRVAGVGRMYTDEQIDEKIKTLLALGVRNQSKVSELANAQDAVTQHNDVQDKTPKLSLKGLYYIAGKAWPF